MPPRKPKRDEDRNRDWADLLAELEDVTARAGPTPCTESLAWLSDQPAVQAEAASACLECPPDAFKACLAYITAWPKESGTYAGLTQQDRARRKKTR